MKRAPTLSIMLVCLGAAVLAVPAAYAHFNLMAPANWLVQNGSGDPQKTAPCGMQTGAVATSAVTTYKTGDMVTITIQETVMHPGHYRVSLAPTQAALPPDPPVIAGTTACGSTAITTTPTLPLLADGLLVHTTALVGPQMVKVALPPGMTCDHCVLQVQEFMSDHGAPCFYHHCATINITADGTPPPATADAGVNGDAAIGGPGATSGGCTVGGASSLAVALVLAAAFARSRRRSVNRS